jgi:PAS domain S-box-containing protein
MARSLETKIFWNMLQFIAVVIIPVAWLAYVVRFVGLGRWMTLTNVIILSVIPLTFLALVFTNDFHGLVWSSNRLVDVSGWKALEQTYGWGVWAFFGYACLLAAATMFLVIRINLAPTKMYRRQGRMLLVAIMLPVIAAALVLLEINPVPHFQPIALAFNIAGLSVAWMILHFRAGDIVSVSRKAIFETMRDALMVLDNQGHILNVNTAMTEILGLESQSLLTESVEEVLPEVMRHLDQATAYSSEEISFGLDIGERSYDVIASPLSDWQGRLISRIVLFRDVTDRKHAQERLESYSTELMRSNEQLRQFAYVASHDLQEPLRMIVSYLGLLEKRCHGQLTAEAGEFLAYAVNGGKHMQGMIKDLLTYSRVGTRSKVFEWIEAKESVERALDNLGLNRTNGAEISCTELPEVSADRSQLLQLFENLLSNAVKFRRAIPARVRIGAEHRGAEWVFWVADDGIGIDPVYSQRIFEVFQRLYNGGEYPGSGVGLAICRRIVERHGGRIWVESELDEGSTFYFTLPFKEKGRV